MFKDKQKKAIKIPFAIHISPQIENDQSNQCLRHSDALCPDQAQNIVYFFPRSNVFG